MRSARHAGDARAPAPAHAGRRSSPAAGSAASSDRRRRHRSPRRRRTTRPPVTGLKNTGTAPAFSASPCSASMKAWLSMMPVTGDSSALVQGRFGSSAIASAAVSTRMPSTPFASARRLMPASIASSCGVGRDDQLAAVDVRHALLGAVGVERLAAGDAEPRHEAAGRIVDAGVDHLAVARGGLGADAFGGFQDDHLAPGQRQRARHRQADDAGAHHDAIDPLQTSSPCWRPARFTLSIRQALGWRDADPAIGQVLAGAGAGDGAIVGWTPRAAARPDAGCRLSGNVRGLACFPLVPFSNRIAQGRFHWDAHLMDRNFGDHPHTTRVKPVSHLNDAINRDNVW